MPNEPPTLWTIGHSTRSLEELIGLLAAHSIAMLADVRRFASSRRHPQFAQPELARRLPEAGIGYQHLPQLGGRRHRRTAGSRHTAWQIEAFRAYADYMETEAFRDGLEELERLALRAPTAMMCAEAVPWRCHRRLIADALVVRGWRVWDILSAGRCQEHRLPPFARVDGGQLSYPGPSGEGS